MTSLVVPFVTAAAAALLLTPLARWIAWRCKALDHADGQRKLHVGPVPHLGGLALMSALLIGTLVGEYDNRFAPPPLLLSACTMCAVGWLDDRYCLRVRWKLFGQMLATLPLVFFGQLIERVECCGFVLELGWWAMPLSIAWYVAGANAMNFIDGADGLAAAVGLVITAAIALVSDHLGHAEAAMLAVVLAGGLAGFLLHNWQPATIYLGDAGSMTAGLWLAAVAAEGSRAPQLGSRLIVLVALLAVPLADVALAVVRRSLRGTRFWLADREHIHHGLLNRGWSVPQVVFVLAGISAIGGTTAFVAAVHGRELIAWAALAALAVAANHFNLAGAVELELLKQFVTRRMLDSLAIVSIGKKRRVSPEQLDRLPLPAAWALFLADVERHQIDELELTVAGGGNDWRHFWQGPLDPSETVASWSLDVAVREPSGTSCRLRATIRQGPPAAPYQLLLLGDTLRAYAGHWARHSDALGSVLRPVAPPTLTITPMSGDDLAKAA
ncbi:MAG TPA: MraY family glycosyltransferase [Pirellulales bacterium]|jgi:UDP-GlcNAc:undecaprenyl-phosphate GlcNAc-1-phosphate transferase|nr:MraY family glycosyltransferase [Pirellulales bacterium]